MSGLELHFRKPKKVATVKTSLNIEIYCRNREILGTSKKQPVLQITYRRETAILVAIGSCHETLDERFRPSPIQRVPLSNILSG